MPTVTVMFSQYKCTCTFLIQSLNIKDWKRIPWQKKKKKQLHSENPFQAVKHGDGCVHHIKKDSSAALDDPVSRETDYGRSDLIQWIMLAGFCSFVWRTMHIPGFIYNLLIPNTHSAQYAFILLHPVSCNDLLSGVTQKTVASFMSSEGPAGHHCCCLWLII